LTELTQLVHPNEWSRWRPSAPFASVDHPANTLLRLHRLLSFPHGPFINWKVFCC